MVHIYDGRLLSHKNNEIIPLEATWMDLEMIILNEVSQTEKGEHHMISLICGIFKKKRMMQMSISIKQKQIHRLRE